jgi:hypothetical protein
MLVASSCESFSLIVSSTDDQVDILSFYSECASLELQLQLGVTKNVTSGETSSPLPTRSNDRLVHPISPMSFSSNRLNRLTDTQRRLTIPDLRSFLSANNTGVQRELYSSCPINSTIATWPFATTALPTSDPAYLGGRDIQFYALDREKTGGIPTGVIYVSTFSPDVVDDTTCFNRFVLDIVLGLQNFTTAGVERILVDTSVSRAFDPDLHVCGDDVDPFDNSVMRHRTMEVVMFTCPGFYSSLWLGEIINPI